MSKRLYSLVLSRSDLNLGGKKMRLITTTEKTAEIFGDEESVRILAEAGFDEPAPPWA